MMAWKSACMTALVLALLVGGCGAPPAPSTAGTEASTSARSTTQKRITAAITGNPTLISFKLIAGGSRAGVDAVEELVHAALSVYDDRGELRPRLAEAVPSLENGLWKLSPDGRMETTWRIRPGVEWHDGAPFTADDLAFTVKVGRDKDLPAFGDRAFDFIEGVEVTDPRSITVRWRAPYTEADSLFTRSLASPLPRHLLERAYTEDPANLLQQLYWNEEFVGLGPYRLREYVRGSHLVVEANDRYLLGRPKVDVIEVRSISDVNTLMVNVLAGEAELTMGYGMSIPQGLQIRTDWHGGRVEFAFNTFALIHPQFINPNPAVITNVDFRRALLHAIDRQQMADVLQAGLTPIAHNPLSPDTPYYRDIEDSIVRYAYDPRRAVQLIEALGYTRDSSGTFRDVGGQRLGVEIRGGSGIDVTRNAIFPVADYWGRVGVAAEPVIVPEQRARDREYEATRPAFELTRTSSNDRFLPRLHSQQVPLPENNFRGSTNPRYMNPEFDALLDSYAVTIPRTERMRVLGQIINHITNQVIVLSLFYDPEPVVISDRLQQVGIAKGSGTVAWNVHEWDVQ